MKLETADSAFVFDLVRRNGVAPRETVTPAQKKRR
jgi:hypothetical protein